MTIETAFLDGYVPPKEQSRALVLMGRPRMDEVAPDVAEKICDLVQGGRSIQDISKMPDMPGARTIREWISRFPDFKAQYLAAKELFAHDAVVKTIDIADDRTLERADRSMSIDTRFRALSYLTPKFGPDGIAPSGAETLEKPRNGDDAKIIDAVPSPENHPLRQAIEAWKAGGETVAR